MEAVVDLTSDSDPEVDARMVVGVDNDFQTALEYWANVSCRFKSEHALTLKDKRISWSLHDDLLAMDNFESQLMHCQSMIDSRLNAQYFNGFKIGITYVPHTRWRMYRRSDPHFSEMHLLCVHNDADFIMALECALLDVYRRYTRKDELGNPKGHALCLNRASGGESGSHGFAPHFVYLTVRCP